LGYFILTWAWDIGLARSSRWSSISVKLSLAAHILATSIYHLIEWFLAGIKRLFILTTYTDYLFEGDP
jgi:hypothetical protein